MRKEIEIRVYGRVQGIRFRSTVKRKADTLGLKGYVLNKDDGSVESVAQGDKKKLEEFMSWIQGSPGFSNVRKAVCEWRGVSRDFADFSIIKKTSFVRDKAKSILNLGAYLFGKQNKIPNHVAIIPDGNRRWARQRGLAPQFGHYNSASLQHMKEIIGEAKNSGVNYLTFWGFSTENWKRDKTEINALFSLILNSIREFSSQAEENKIRFRHIGRKDRLPRKLIEALEELEEKTRDYDELNVQFCLDYGGQDEIIRAVNRIIRKGIKRIDEKMLEENLDSAGMPNVDLIIRTSGEKRLSGFMPLQSAYAELYFSEVHFPDFDASEFRRALSSYGKRDRRFGGNSK